MNESHFPVVYSTLDSEALVSLVLSQYGLGDQLCCQFWHRGLSDIYLVTTPQSQYVLRVSHTHWRSRPEIEFELDYLRYIHHQSIPVAIPLPNQQGRFLVDIHAPEGSRFATLFPYAPGKIPLGDLSPLQGKVLGRVVAQMHNAGQLFQSAGQRPSLEFDYLYRRSCQDILPFLRHRPEDSDYLISLGQEIQNKLRSLPQVAPFWTVCWGDPHSGNMHFTDDDTLTLFDFDQCGYGWRAFDIGKFLQISIRSGLNRAVRDAFLTGYEEVSPLTEMEMDALQAFTQIAHLWSWSISLHSAKLHNSCQLDDSFFTQRLHQLKRLKSPEWQLF
ncbi:phosphotransferase [Lyngbya confervoides]|uniref:Phosphotransferase n=1 Tax=Lyngbya confervoides BDU141951 TaxID=1574623 RepID=A0ABD4SYU1_9CYAN|nr:phosphotransferase [Lyngbya confervoides]MCM1981311.1 phosphotransferase [Lyngbya confervoides BDU141951]